MRGDKMQRILVVGWKRGICIKALMEALKDHNTALQISRDTVIDLEDNTIYNIITNTINDPTFFHGRAFDQVMRVDDFRGELFANLQGSILCGEINKSLVRSCVPDDYKVIYYEYPQATKEQKIDYYSRRF